jgi:hypothetical protein
MLPVFSDPESFPRFEIDGLSRWFESICKAKQSNKASGAGL